MELLKSLGIDAVLRKNVRRGSTKEPRVSISSYSTGAPRIALTVSAVRMVLGHDKDLNVVLALSRDAKSLYIVVCDPEEMNSILLKANGAGSYQTTAGDIGTRLGVTKTISFSGVMVAKNRNVFEIELQKHIKE
jgi:hypothetical protein